MPSTHKTAFLRLNRWLGLDKPKKDDFVSDNQIIDENMQSLSQSLSALTQRCVPSRQQRGEYPWKNWRTITKACGLLSQAGVPAFRYSKKHKYLRRKRQCTSSSDATTPPSL